VPEKNQGNLELGKSYIKLGCSFCSAPAAATFSFSLKKFNCRCRRAEEEEDLQTAGKVSSIEVGGGAVG
jgi:hypothetical protein